MDYERHGRTYAQHRRPDSRIAARIHAALGDARTVLNVGAGTGSYEPTDRWVLAVEPSATMRAQRPVGAAPAIAARAEALPLDDDAVDAAMACVTIHHWESPEAGLGRAASRRRAGRSWSSRLSSTPACVAARVSARGCASRASRGSPRSTMSASRARRTYAGGVESRRPAIASTGFSRRSGGVRRRCSTRQSAVPSRCGRCSNAGVEQRIVDRLAAALDSGAWDAEHGHLREQDSFQGALRLVISEPD